MDPFPFFLAAPRPDWSCLYRDETDPDKIIGRITVDFGFEVKDVETIEEYTFATLVINGAPHRIAMRSFPGVYALSLKSEDAEVLEKRLRAESGVEGTHQK